MGARPPSPDVIDHVQYDRAENGRLGIARDRRAAPFHEQDAARIEKSV